MQKHTHAPKESLCLNYTVRAEDVERGGMISSAIKTAIKKFGLAEPVARRVGIIAFEGEMNLIVYSNDGGTIRVCADAKQIEITVKDTGPGIEDIDLALTPGYSTAPSWATDLGFGAGMGLHNMEKNADRFEIESRLDEGTTIKCWVDRRTDDSN